jgi:hypothetical protein
VRYSALSLFSLEFLTTKGRVGRISGAGAQMGAAPVEPTPRRGRPAWDLMVMPYRLIQPSRLGRLPAPPLILPRGAPRGAAT